MISACERVQKGYSLCNTLELKITAWSTSAGQGELLPIFDVVVAVPRLIMHQQARFQGTRTHIKFKYETKSNGIIQNILKQNPIPEPMTDWKPIHTNLVLWTTLPPNLFHPEHLTQHLPLQKLRQPFMRKMRILRLGQVFLDFVSTAGDTVMQ